MADPASPPARRASDERQHRPLRVLPIVAVLAISFAIGLAALLLPRQSQGSQAGTSVPVDSALAQATAIPTPSLSPPTPTATPQNTPQPTAATTPTVANTPTFAPPSPTVGATAVQAVSGRASATPTPPPSLADILARTTAAEAALRSGEFDATIEYGDGSRSVVRVRFDLGNGQQPRRLHIASTSQSTTGSTVFEQIAIGEQTWQRQADGSWTPAPTQDGMWEQIQAYLPNSRTIANATLTGDGRVASVSYRDEALNADTILTVDPATGTPLQLRQQIAAGGPAIAVVYHAWNVPVAIQAPLPR